MIAQKNTEGRLRIANPRECPGIERLLLLSKAADGKMNMKSISAAQLKTVPATASSSEIMSGPMEMASASEAANGTADMAAAPPTPTKMALAYRGIE